MSQIINLEYFRLVITDIASKFIEREVRLNKGRSIMPPGHNGPYYDLETPVRNTAHWLCTYSTLYRDTQEEKYSEIANRLANFLLEPGFHMKDGVYIHRQKPGKDWCNGIIGQAWVIEALNIASNCLDRPELKEAAIKSAKVFSYNRKVRAWVKIDPQNGKKAIDYTLNHQTWFAAVLIELKDPSLEKDVLHYLDGLSNGAMRIRSDGVIAHLLYKSDIKGQLLKLRYKFSEKRAPKEIREKEVGYHLFNLHPFARIYKQNPGHRLFSSVIFKKALDVAYEDSFIKELSRSQYAYPYNAPAFEYPLVSLVFEKHLPQEIVRQQLDRSYIPTLNAFSNCPDSTTLNARIYEFFS